MLLLLCIQICLGHLKKKSYEFSIIIYFVYNITPSSVRNLFIKRINNLPWLSNSMYQLPVFKNSKPTGIYLLVISVLN